MNKPHNWLNGKKFKVYYKFDDVNFELDEPELFEDIFEGIMTAKREGVYKLCYNSNGKVLLVSFEKVIVELVPVADNA